jgi:hypothetical protein
MQGPTLFFIDSRNLMPTKPSLHHHRQQFGAVFILAFGWRNATWFFFNDCSTGCRYTQFTVSRRSMAFAGVGKQTMGAGLTVKGADPSLFLKKLGG